MAHYAIRNLPPGLIPRAKARARADETTLDAVLLTYLTRYAEGTPSAQQLGGQARVAGMTGDERSALARHAAQHRWGKPAAKTEE